MSLTPLLRSLGEVAAINPPLDCKLNLEDKISFVPMAAIDADASSLKRVAERRYGEVCKGYTPFQSGDVLVAKITPCFENGKVAQANLPTKHGFGSTEFHVLRPRDERLDSRYLLHYLRRSEIRSAGERRMTGSAGQRRVPESFLCDLKIPLPSVLEQRRIAAILDEAEALRAQRHAFLKGISSLRISIYENMFEQPGVSWPVVRLAEISDVQGGLQITGARKSNPVEIAYLRVANVFRGFLDLSEVKTLRATEAEVRRTLLAKDDLLVVEGHGNPNEIGRVAVWTGAVEPCVHQNHLIRVRLDARRSTAAYLCAFLNSRSGRQHILRAGKTTSGLNTISVSNVRDTPVVLPPLSMQTEFQRRLAQVEQLERRGRDATEVLDTLQASLQHRAFSGQL